MLFFCLVCLLRLQLVSALHANSKGIHTGGVSYLMDKKPYSRCYEKQQLCDTSIDVSGWVFRLHQLMYGTGFKFY